MMESKMEKYLVPLETPCVYYDESFLVADQDQEEEEEEDQIEGIIKNNKDNNKDDDHNENSSFNDGISSSRRRSLEELYDDLLKNTSWEKTAKINRWVCLQQEELELQSSSTTTNGEEEEEESTTEEEAAVEGGGGGNIMKSKKNEDNNNKNNNKNNNNNNKKIGNSVYQYRDAPNKSASTTISADNKESSSEPQGFSNTVKYIQQHVEKWYYTKTKQRIHFNVCLLNYYENGQQRIGWHSDREEIGRTTPIASISLGATRTLLIRSKNGNGIKDRCNIQMKSGSIVIMENICQLQYLHSVPKEDSVVDGRINLTFRCKQFQTKGEIEHEHHDQWLQQITVGAIPTSKGWSSTTTKTTTAEAATPTTTTTTDDDVVVKVFGDDVKRGCDLSSSTTSTSKSRIYFLVKTNLGAEGYCAAEIKESLLLFDDNNNNAVCDWDVIAQPLSMDGYVAVCYSNNDDDCGGTNPKQQQQQQPDHTTTILSTIIKSKLLNLKSALHVLQYHTHFNLEDLVNDEFPEPKLIDGETLYQYFKKKLVDGSYKITTLEEINNNNNNNNTTNVDDAKGTFRVTCERIGGPHSFKSTGVEYEIGGAMSEYYTNIKPKMIDYDVNIRVDVIGYVVVVGTQLNVTDITKDRHFLRYRNIVTIKANIAYAMVRLAAIPTSSSSSSSSGGDGDATKTKTIVVDPFCGSGTLLLEALDIYKDNISSMECIGLDVARRTIDGARENAKAEGYSMTDDKCKFIVSDARGLRRHLTDNSVDAMISNLPWGIKTGNQQVNGISDLQTMYEIFLRTAWYTLKDGARIVVFVLRGLQFVRLVRKLSGRYKLLHVNIIRTANNLPALIVIEKLAYDEIRDSIKGQLAYLNQYVNVSRELYEAIHMETIDADDG